MNDNYKLFIVEGVERDYRFVKGMTDLFMRGRFETKMIYLPAAQNIYMLYERLKKDDFDTDIVEVLRENSELAQSVLEGITRQQIDEVYLFFDFDVHQNNLGQGSATLPEDVIINMLEVFDNETDNGKLYISYPMVEAFYDYKENQCQAFYKCFVSTEELINYKRLSGNNNPKANFHNSITDWEQILYTFGLRIKCLFDDDYIDYYQYRNKICPLEIYKYQADIYDKLKNVFVLSALPEFLFDYFNESFWHKYWKKSNFQFESCEKKELL